LVFILRARRFPKRRNSMTRPLRARAPRATRPDLALLALGLVACVAFPVAAWATGRDFADETLVAEGMRRGETGLELGADARVDSLDQLQGWFAGALEYGLTSRWVAETVVQGLSRGRGLEFAGWRLESRYVALEQPKLPFSVAAAAEYEVESNAAKHTLYERVLTPRLVVTRVFSGTFLVTGNAGIAWELDPVKRSRFAWAVGARWPDHEPVAVGAEITHEPLERATRIVPQVTLQLPNEMSIRMAGGFGVHPRPYRFIARIIVERELEL